MPDSLQLIAERTLGHYELNASGFWEGTRDHDVSANLEALLTALGDGPQQILDFGCGPGRDLATLRALGHVPVGLDGCRAFVRMARKHSGCEVLEQSFFELALGAERFDGVFANASLFHVPRTVLPEVLTRVFAAIKPGGVLFCSNPRAFTIDSEGWHGQRYGCYLTIESWSGVIARAGFALERHYLRPSGKPPAEQPWLAMVWRKPR
jgi:2-polyprenyl-3-methyl-5-hydroxy-6-metoxy-1,4-benzoquinol methylase